MAMATVPSPKTWTVGELLTAAKMNQEVRDPLNFLLSTKPICILKRTATQSVSYGAAVQYDTEIVDRDNGHSTSSNSHRYNVGTAGLYNMTAYVQFTDAFSAGESRQLSFTHNNSNDVSVTSIYQVNNSPPNSFGMNTTVSISLMLNCAVDDWMYTAVAFDPSGGSKTIGVAFFCLEWIGTNS